MSTRPRLRALALDLDGTLLTSSSALSERTIAALQKFHRSGGVVVIATGRWREFTVDTAHKLGHGVVTYLVCQDGGLVLKRLDGSDVWKELAVNLHSSTDAARVLERIRSALRGLCSFGVVRLRGRNFGEPGYYELLQELPSYAKMFANLPSKPLVVEDCQQELLSCSTDVDHVYFMRVLPKERGISATVLLQRVEAVCRLEKEEHGLSWDIQASDWKLADGTGAIVVRTAGINKAVGLQSVGAELAWDGAAAGKGWCAFGDNWNDLEMLAWAEWSVAAANGIQTAKEAAKEMSSLTNDEDFVADVIEQELGRLSRI
eukprot:gnl/TRDRNA2_/TRDRNA2_192144_c0_seq1.p1 gnl/TRDRNA2_/TRDRNA2_192144_c0~~gnl/TRDRNA2_/TRDRNA2_192144_c0_seq1.p1  ORF type:complete len:317 (-),score=69.63 gnl/TRDRNA2_/TRDRNA2_192144_c0_seq1:65-1015(-)